MAFDIEEEEEEEEESYLASYSDLVTDLMAIFVLLFSFAMMATAQQNYNMKQEMQEKDGKSQSIVAEATDSASASQEGDIQDDLDMVYQAVKKRIEEGKYHDGITLERGEGYITFKFRDSVLFYPDSPQIRPNSFELLEYLGDLLYDIRDDIATIAISGHTAKISDDETAHLIAWDLSTNRAISVLKFFVDECALPQGKMTVAGYAHYQPVAENDTEEGRAQNRRVEIKISRQDS